jgi:murein DD-endopeptidase MepM/ murein hydrolase activator NlpD
MRIGALPPPDPATPNPAARESAAPGARFSALLAEQLREPLDTIELTRTSVRAAIEEGRPGVLDAVDLPLAGAQSARSTYAPLSRTANAADPFGWRAMTRRIGDEVVGPGFGTLFEAQIQQESGFDPEVVFGYRRSSAGAEGIAQLMPQYYPGVNRRDPQASLVAGAQSMRHYLSANGGDVRKALASYNAGLGTVQSLVAAHGADWERGLPAETKQYLASILGDSTPAVRTNGPSALPFGGRGPHGVLTSPVEHVLGQRDLGGALALLTGSGAPVYAPADGRITSTTQDRGGFAIEIDHGNGWASLLSGLGSTAANAGDLVRRGQALGTLPATATASAMLRMALAKNGQEVDPRPYILGGLP